MEVGVIVAKQKNNEKNEEETAQQEFGKWDEKQKILVILAHPDDPEFFCGATLAKWIKEGHEVHYFLLTCGDKGSDEPDLSADQICRVRHEEQLAAASVLGVKSIQFLDLPDGYLLPTIDIRREVVRAIRKFKPEILVTCDPTNLFPVGSYRLNHADHRYAGQVVLDAVFPAAGNIHFFPELYKEEKLEPHSPNEVWISLTSNPDITLDVTDTWEIKMQALLKHKSQIGNPEEFQERIKKWKSAESTDENPKYEEKFRLIKWN